MEINLEEGVKYPRSAKKIAFGGGQNLNRKFKTFGFLDSLEVHIHYTVQLSYKQGLYLSIKQN